MNRRNAPRLLANLLYGLYMGVLGVVLHSWWFIALAAYDIVLTVLRFALELCRTNRPEEIQRFVPRFTGGMLLFLSVTMAGITYLCLLDERGSHHHVIVMITLALYAFTKITLAIVRMVRHRDDRHPAVRCLRNVRLADGAVSIFALQRSMLVSFEGMTPQNIQLMNALTGTAVYLMIAILGINLIGGKRVIMAKSKLVEANEKIAEAVTGGYKKIETGVVEGYEKIEKGVVEGYEKIEKGVVEGYTKLEDKFIDRFLAHEGETVEEARERLKKNVK